MPLIRVPRPHTSDRGVSGLGTQVDGTSRDLQRIHTAQHEEQTIVIHRSADANPSDESELYFIKLRVDTRIVCAGIMTESTLTAHDSNYATVQLKEIYEDGTARVLGEIKTQTQSAGGTGDWVAGDYKRLCLNQNETKNKSRLVFSITKSGGGVAVPEACWNVHYTKKS
jgi:hypothetical protein